MPTPFDTFTLEADGVVLASLTVTPRRILRATHGSTAFVIAHTDDRDPAFALAAAEAADHDAPIYTILLTEQQLDGIRAGHDQNVDVHDGHNNHQVVGTIEANNDADALTNTAHGILLTARTLSDSLTKGAVFLGGDCTDNGDLVVHRALTDYNPETGEIDVHVLERGWDDYTDETRADLTNRILVGPDHLVDLLDNDERDDLLKHLQLRDITESSTLSHRAQTPDFTRFTIAAGGTIGAAIADHRILDAMFCNIFFVVAHADTRDDTLAHADQLADVHEGLRFVYTVLLTDEHLAALTGGAPDLYVPILDAQRQHRAAPTAIKVTTGTGANITTKHGVVACTAATAADVHAGDVYTLGTTGFGEDAAFFTVYRALADYNPETGRVEHHVVKDGWKPGDYHGALTDGPNTVVNLVDDPAALLARYSDLAGIPDHA
jgi:hypothetical protein